MTLLPFLQRPGHIVKPRREDYERCREGAERVRAAGALLQAMIQSGNIPLRSSASAPSAPPVLAPAVAQTDANVTALAPAPARKKSAKKGKNR